MFFVVAFSFLFSFSHGSKMRLAPHFGKHTDLIYSSHIIITLNSPLHTKSSVYSAPSEFQALVLVFRCVLLNLLLLLLFITELRSSD